MAKSLEVETGPHTSRVPSFAFWITYLLTALAIVLLYSSIFRPMWIDEAIHFVLSGQPTFGDLLLRLHNPDAGFLTRQTGFYQVINYLTLQVTGANWIALRLPSILSAGLMIWAMYIFLRERGVTRTFQFIGLIALAGQAGLMYFVGEARPYLPYAATTLGILAFLTASESSQRNTSVKWLGLLSLYFGALVHLYFLLILPIIVAYSVWFHFFTARETPTWPALFRVSHIKLVGGSVILALSVGLLTWMRPQETNQFAFEWTTDNLSSLAKTVIFFHLEFLLASALRTSFLIIEVCLVFYLLFSRRYRYHRQLFASAVLVLGAALTTAVIAGSSIANNYFVGDRQLLVGPMLIVIAFTWQLSTVFLSAKRIQVNQRDMALGVVLGLVYGLVLLEMEIRIPAIPLSLLVTANVFVTAAATFARSDKWASRRLVLVIALVTALGLVCAVLSLTTRLASHWQSQAALALALVVILVLAATMWRGRARRLTLAAVVLAAVLAPLGTSALIYTSSRFAVITSEYSAKAKLEKEVASLEESTLLRYQNLDANSILDLQAPVDPAWVYLSNINALRGGPVWAGLGDL